MIELTVEMKYQGPVQGSFAITSPLTGKVYVIDGRGAQFLVDPDDALWLEETFVRYGQEYVRVARQSMPSEPDDV